MKYRRILLKLSGESLGLDGKLFDHDKIEEVAQVLKQIAGQGVELGVVIGAGNLWRGRQGKSSSMGAANADQMGMLGTAINCIYMRDALERIGAKAYVQSAVDMLRFMEPYNPQAANDHLSQGHILLFACGTGNPLFSTDSAVMLRAIELKADAVLMAKNIDGVYDKDPRLHSDAVFIKDLTYKQAQEQNLQVMDTAAFAMCQENAFPMVRVFELTPQNILDVLKGKDIGTFVHP